MLPEAAAQGLGGRGRVGAEVGRVWIKIISFTKQVIRSHNYILNRWKNSQVKMAGNESLESFPFSLGNRTSLPPGRLI